MKFKFMFGLLAIVIGVIAVCFVLASKHALVVQPKGTIAAQELELIITNILLMLVIIVPTYILLFSVVWKYCLKKKKGDYDPEHSFGAGGDLLMWILPSIVVAVMAVITWRETHNLNPYKPIVSDKKTVPIQVVAMDWKWLFIYPEQGIATLNFIHIPEKTPIHFRLTADGAPMNSFWVPQLSGQIYSMTGMSTQLFLMADKAGEFAGRAVEINGEGYSGMTFTVTATSEKDFENWLAEAKNSPHSLTDSAYQDLVKPSINRSQILFTDVEEGLYQKIIDKYMFPPIRVL